MQDKNVLLMTATIKPFVHTVNSNEDVRRKEYEHALEKYITLSDFDDIVFAENSGAYFDIERFSKLAQQHGKRLEYLNLGSCTEKTFCDIGVAEALLLHNALQNSTVLRECRGGIWKVTGKLWISNINEILKKSFAEKNIFLYAYADDYVETWLYKIHKNLIYRIFGAKDDFLPLFMHIVQNGSWAVMERSLRKILFDNEIKVTVFPEYPLIEHGMYNSLGAVYRGGFLKCLRKRVLLKLGCFTVPQKHRKDVRKRSAIVRDIYEFGFGYFIRKNIYKLLAKL